MELTLPCPFLRILHIPEKPRFLSWKWIEASERSGVWGKFFVVVAKAPWKSVWGNSCRPLGAKVHEFWNSQCLVWVLGDAFRDWGPSQLLRPETWWPQPFPRRLTYPKGLVVKQNEINKINNRGRRQEMHASLKDGLCRWLINEQRSQWNLSYVEVPQRDGRSALARV